VNRHWHDRIFLAVSGLLAAGSVAGAAEFSGYLVATTDYVYRGVTYSDGHGALQIGGDVALESGLYFGLWASTTDISNGPTRQRDNQVNYYLGYSFGLGKNWSLGTSLVAYTFPATTGEFDYDYEELTLSANYQDRLWLEYSWSPDLYASGRQTHNVELYTEWPLPNDFSIGGGAGYYDVSAFSGEGYGYWQFGLSKSLGPVDVDVRFHDTNRAVPIVSSPERAESRVSLSLRLQF